MRQEIGHRTRGGALAAGFRAGLLGSQLNEVSDETRLFQHWSHGALHCSKSRAGYCRKSTAFASNELDRNGAAGSLHKRLGYTPLGVSKLRLRQTRRLAGPMGMGALDHISP